ncbi:DUF6776 family protein [Halioglobus pacificus]|uniref:Uncharacterized protein n=1 Tax=Parahalioglobus pacificus TaxID=930806 RepID=A0A918XIR3_9GAMM|nr:DUF6776 family protein [Halioglobus pacificus]GHD33394.1 hypothetical protein GCM10007053_17730 [Halioglobus pacificus]
MPDSHYKTVVRREHPYRPLFLAGLGLLLVGGGAVAGFILGGVTVPQPTEPELVADAQVPAEADPGVLSLEQQIVSLDTRNEVDRATIEILRREIAQQKLQIAELEEGIQFYRGLMAPGEIGQGLSLRPMELVSTGVERRYLYRLVAQQEARKHSTLQGELYAEIVGTVDGERKTYPLSSLTDDMETSVQKLRFKYFQSVEGELTLPEGFQPEVINVVASARTPRNMEAREQYIWQPQEKFTNVGK